MGALVAFQVVIIVALLGVSVCNIFYFVFFWWPDARRFDKEMARYQEAARRYRDNQPITEVILVDKPIVLCPICGAAEGEYCRRETPGKPLLLAKACGNAPFQKTVVAEPKKRYWISPAPKHCDFLRERDRPEEHDISKVFVDGATIYGKWAIMCAICHKAHGSQRDGGIGLGQGQRYEKQEDGRWLKIAG